MITVNNLSVQFGGSVLFKQVDLQFTAGQLATASSAPTARENPPF